MNSAALLLIDVQQGMDDPCWGERNNPDAERNMVRLLGAWRERGLPVIHIQHKSVNPRSPLRPDAPGNAFKPKTAPLPNETVFTKTGNSAFVGMSLEGYLREEGIMSLVVVGLTTDHCAPQRRAAQEIWASRCG